MRPAYFRQDRFPRQRRVVAALPGRRDRYIMRESSPYSLASMDDGLGFSFKSVTKSITKAVSQVAKVGFTAAKQAVVVQANMMTLGAATKFTGMGKWSGTKTAAKIGTGVGIGMAAIAAAVVAAPVVAGAFGAAGTAGTAGSAGIGGGGFLSFLGTGLKGAATLSPMAMALLKAKKAKDAAADAPLVTYGEGTGYPPGAFPGTWIGSLPVGGGGGGGGFGPEGTEETATNWLPLLLVGGIGVALIMQRR